MAPRLTRIDPDGFKGYAKRLREMAKQAPKAADSYVKHLALATQYMLIMATPIRSGRARANWQVGLNTIYTNYRFAKPSHPRPGAYLAQVQEQLASNEQTIRQYKDGDVIYITTNIPYSLRLNQGWSKQAPPGYIEYAIENAREQVKPRKAGLSGLITSIPVERLGEMVSWYSARQGVIPLFKPIGIKSAIPELARARRRR